MAGLQIHMKTLIPQLYDPKLSPAVRRFCSYLLSVDNPSISCYNPPHNITTFHPLQFLNDYSKSGNCTVKDTKIIHAHFLKTSTLHSHVSIANILLACYCKLAAIDYALKLFEKTPNRDTGSWNLIISCQNRNFLFQDSWRTFCRMRSLGFMPDEFSYGSLIAACKALQSSFCGQQVYSLALRDGMCSNSYIMSGMIDFFSENGCFEDALKVFNDGSWANVVCWNAIISAAVKHKEERIAFNLFFRMCRGALRPSKFTFPSVLTACATVDELFLGRGIHGLVIKYGEVKDVFIGTALVDLYSSCGDMDEAMKAFLQMSSRNVVSWTAIISGFVQNGNFKMALRLFKDMIDLREDISNYTITSVLMACSDPPRFIETLQIHCWLFKTAFNLDPVVKASLISLYSKMEIVDLCELVFSDTEDTKHPKIWAVMISAFAKNEASGRAINLFKGMFWEDLRPDKFCTSSILSVINCLELGKQIHGYTLKAGVLSDVSVGSSLFTMYSKCGSLEESLEVFEQMPDRDSVSWSSMISGFAEHGNSYEAIQLFQKMQSEEAIMDVTTLRAVLMACSSPPFLKIGKEIHGYSVRQGISNTILGCGALVNMYSKCDALQLARKVFDLMPLKDHVSCSSLVSGYAQRGYVAEALQLFRNMIAADLDIDSFTITFILGELGLSNRSDIGGQLHSYILKRGLESLAAVGSSLVMMYSKCGSIDDCRKGFEEIVQPDLFSWTALITSYAQNGKGSEALEAYERMKKCGIKPDSVTFVGVLSACSHNGLVAEGYFQLKSMVDDFGLKPNLQHYACMVDLLGRSGRLEEAERFINEMQIKPDALVWGTLLAACKVHGNVEIGRIAARKFVELEPFADGAFVSLSNIYADLGQFEEVLKIRSEMKGTSVKKQPAWSYV